MNGRRHDEHGNRGCYRRWAHLVRCKPKTTRFTYCQAVLMKHRVIECNHDCQDEIVETVRRDNWHDIGPIDLVSVILIRNG